MNDISEYDINRLKALAYELIVSQHTAQRDLVAVEARIAELAQKQSVKLPDQDQ